MSKIRNYRSYSAYSSNKKRELNAPTAGKKMISVIAKKKPVLQLFCSRFTIDIPREHFEPTSSLPYVVSVHYFSNNCRSGLDESI